MLPVGFPAYKTVQRRLKLWLALALFPQAWQQRAERYQPLQGINWDQVRLDGAKKPAQTGGHQPGPSPVDRGQWGTALQLAGDGRAMALGALVTPANANAGCHSQALLAALAVPAPAPTPLPVQPDTRSLPTAQADGAYGNRPARQRASVAGFRLQAPARGQRQPGVGQLRQAVERGHHFFAQFGRLGRRLDRSAKCFLGWIEWAACVIFLRSGLVR